MTVEDQLAAIRDPAFFAAMKGKIKQVLSSLTTNNVVISGTITVMINSVSVMVTQGTDDTMVAVGTADDGAPLYSWKYPTNWLTA